ncbi:MAG: amylo-alpha-1,6-glucosidase, partial [Actinomycetota bacterium]|nr:amylo-alpha-1,6-glucosidase [Actinomycetota bacterium]
MTGGTVTLFEGAAFCTAAAGGDIVPGGVQGLFVLDARVLSELVLLVDGVRPQALGARVSDPNQATFVGRVGDSIAVERHRVVDDGLRDEVVIRNVGEEAAYVAVEVRAHADFASLAEVRAGRPGA